MKPLGYTLPHTDVSLDKDELIPVEGKDEEYDGINQEIRELEEELDEALKEMKKQTRFILAI